MTVPNNRVAKNRQEIIIMCFYTPLVCYTWKYLHETFYVNRSFMKIILFERNIKFATGSIIFNGLLCSELSHLCALSRWSPHFEICPFLFHNLLAKWKRRLEKPSNLETFFLNLRRSLSDNVDFRPLFLFADVVSPWFVRADITLQTVALDTPDNVAVFVTGAPAKRGTRVCLLSQSDKSPISRFFHTDCHSRH
jgi:hypothetical protein